MESKMEVFAQKHADKIYGVKPPPQPDIRIGIYSQIEATKADYRQGWMDALMHDDAVKELSFRKAEIGVYKEEIANLESLLQSERQKSEELERKLKVAIEALTSVDGDCFINELCMPTIAAVQNALTELTKPSIPHKSVAKFVEILPTVEARNKENI